MKTKIITAVSLKGGSGKSTALACLAAEMHKRGTDVALLDCDPQATLSDWHRGAGPMNQLPLSSASGAGVDPTLQTMAKQHEILMVDTAGFGNRDTLSVLRWAHVAIVPFGPSPADAVVTLRTLKMLSDVNATQERRRNPVKVYLLATRQENTALARNIREQLSAAAAGSGAFMLESKLNRRVAYAEAMLAGSAPCWMPGAGAAAAEVSALLDEITI